MVSAVHSGVMTAETSSGPRRIRRVVRRAALALFAVVLGLAGWDVATYDEQAWRADYERLKSELAQRYANLDWIVSHRGLDLQALDAATSAAIDGAHSRVRAVLALRRFVRSFDDPHLRLVRGDRSAAQASAPETEAVPVAPHSGAVVTSCKAAGYEAGDYAFHFPFERMEGWVLVRKGHFPTGLSGDLGVLRIASFGEDQYLQAAEQAFQPGIQERALRLATRALLQRELTDALVELRARGARRLLVDITGNGGGTEWVTEVVALLTDRELQRQTARLVAPAGDRSGIWRGEQVPPVLGPPGPPTRLVGTGVWTGPLFVLADRGTGSASEDFVAWLQQNGAAVVLGERTAGAGGGYVNGGGRIRLSAGPFDVMAPNCARFLEDGTNEIEGLAPDVELPMDEADDAQLVSALARGLRN